MLGLTVAAAAALWLARERLRTRDSQRVRRCLAAALLSNELLSWLIGAMEGRARVPLQLCDLSAHPSLLDTFGPWPWYLLGMEAVVFVSLMICYAPFALSRRTDSQRV